MTRDIKKEILTILLKSEKLRYGDIHPEGIDNDLFNYHLQHLVKQGLVDKEAKEYSLTMMGKYYISEQKPISPSGKEVDRFKLNVLTIVLRGQGKDLEVLMQTRKRHPCYGSKSVMGGTMQKGELVIEAAKRKLLVETGLEADFKLCGLLRQINLDAHGILITEDILFHICCTDIFSGELVEKTVYGENFWLTLDQAIDAHKVHPGSFAKLADFLIELKTKDFRKIPLFYWEKKAILQKSA